MQLSTRGQWLKPLEPHQQSRVLWFNVSLSVVLLMAMALLFSPVFDWAWRQIARADRQYHVLVSIFFIALCVYRFIQEKQAIHFARKNPRATLLVCVACTAYLLNQQFLQLNAVSVALFLLCCFGLLGHFVSAQTWRSCLIPLLLAMLVLPFEGYLDIFLGFPMRLLSAGMAVDVLQALRIATVSSDTVLLIDNRAAIVDIDCSGIKGFWIGSIFFCAITWIERYRFNLRWFLIAALAACLLFAGNVVRIVALVVLDLVLDKAELAQLLHESLGLISFAAVLFLSWQLLRMYGARHNTTTRALQSVTSIPYTDSGVSKTTGVLCALLMGFGLSQAQHVKPAQASELPNWTFELAERQFVPKALNPIETQFFMDNGASAFKLAGSIESAGIAYEASVLVVLSTQWKSQHIPEHCYVAQGFDITSSRVLKLNESQALADASFRQLQLVKPSDEFNTKQQFTSDYWFQSISTTTVNYSRRVLSQISNPHEPWAMVSVLWHDGVPASVRQQLLLDIRNTLSREMKIHG